MQALLEREGLAITATLNDGVCFKTVHFLSGSLDRTASIDGGCFKAILSANELTVDYTVTADRWLLQIAIPISFLLILLFGWRGPPTAILFGITGLFIFGIILSGVLMLYNLSSLASEAARAYLEGVEIKNKATATHSRYDDGD
jgi:hypothetical protein